MRRAFIPLALFSLLAIGAVILTGQSPGRQRGLAQYPEWEVTVLHPHEISVGRYAQVRPYELDRAASEGWELVSVTPFVMRNEEHEGPKGERPMVTQVYQSYAFKRLRREPSR